MCPIKSFSPSILLFYSHDMNLFNRLSFKMVDYDIIIWFGVKHIQFIRFPGNFMGN